MPSKIAEALVKIREDRFQAEFEEIAESAHGLENSVLLRILWNNGSVSEYSLIVVDGVPCYVNELEMPTVTLTMDEDTALRIYDQSLTPMAAYQYAHVTPGGFFYGLHVEASDGRPFTHVSKLSSIFDALRPKMGV